MALVVHDQQEIARRRSDFLDKHGSAPLSFLNSGDVAYDENGAGNIIDFAEENKTAIYVPFDTITVTNNSNTPLNIYINQNRSWVKRIPNGVILTIDEFKGIRSIRYAKTDNGVTVSANEIEITVQRSPLNEDELVRRNQSQPLIVRAIKSLLGV